MTDRLGPYRLLGRIGKGGMAEVWQAEREGGKKVALKLMPIDADANRTAVRRFMDEGRLTVQLAHPNIVRVYDFGVEPTRAFIVMELLEGAPLSRLIGAPAAPGLVVATALQVLRGLAYAHAPPFEIIHRDLKPSNLFVTLAGEVKVIDFGIASTPLLDSTRTSTGAFRGSISYANPEQVRGTPLDCRADLFSLALVLRELLTGQRVFDQANDAERIGSLLFRPIPPLLALAPRIGAPLAQALDWGIQREREARPPSAAAWAERLGEALPASEVWTAQQISELVRQRAGSTEPRVPTATLEPGGLDAAPASPAAAGRRRSAPVWILSAVSVVSLAAAVLAWTARPEPLAPPPPIAVTAAAPPPTPVAPEPPAEPVTPAPAPAPVPAPHRSAPAARPRSSAAPIATAKVTDGFLTVESRPDWARIFLNGKDSGPSPVYKQRVRTGRVVVEGVRSDGSRQKRVVEVAADRESVVLLQW